MKVSDKGVLALVIHEGIVPGPYKDSVGVWTYGVGHTKAAGIPDPFLMKRGMPENLDAELRKVFELLKKDLSKYESEVLRAVNVPLTQNEFDALVSFHYNTGAIARASLTLYLKSGNKKAAMESLLSWNKAGGKFSAALAGRRQDEKAIFERGIYPSGNATVWGVDPTGRVIWTPVKRLSPNEVLGLMGPQKGVATPTQVSQETWLSRLLKRIFG
jgi:lysozyme